MKKYFFITLLVCLSPNLGAETILVLGDSISAAYGMPSESGWVHLLKQRLDAQYPARYRVVNASISGDTTASGLRRLPVLLDKHRPQKVVVELGGNDGLRGISLKQMGDNLQQIIDLCRERGASIVIMSIDLPPNYGVIFQRRFRQVFEDLEITNAVPRVPLGFNVLGDRNLLQSDGIHPTAAAQPLLVDAVWSAIISKAGGTP